jgi:predicted transposase YbfD/YdcC
LSDSATVCVDDAAALLVLSSHLSAKTGVGDLGGETGAFADLLEHLKQVPDWRHGRWVDHPLAAVLALCAAAVVAGMRGFTAIAGWVRDVPPKVLASIYVRSGRVGVTRPPSKVTLWRIVTGVPCDVLDAVIGSWLLTRGAAMNSAASHEAGPGELVAIAADGKTVRGAIGPDGAQVHLLAAMTHGTGLVVGQIEVSAKTNEIPMLPDLLDGLDLTDTVLTVDALHTQRTTADYIHRRGGHFVFTAKENQPRLFDALNALPWTDIPIQHTTIDKAHGRIATRTIQVMPAPADLPFPHVKQVWLLERGVIDLHGKSLSNVAALGVTSLTPTLAQPARIAELVRNHWGIESLHWIRDTLYREDDSTTRTRSGPRAMATLRNLAIGAIRLFGRNDITETTRWAHRDMRRPFQILGLGT